MKKRVVLLTIALMLMFTSVVSFANKTNKFKDVKNAEWAAEAIQVLYEQGIISGYDDDTFGVYDPMTREQFAKVLSLTFGTELITPSVSTFKDVNDSNWSFSFVESTKEYLTGYYPPNGKPFFSPNTNATREDVAVALVRAMKLPVDNVDGQAYLKRRITDIESISPRLINEIAVAYENKLLEGFEDGSFRGNASIDRAAVATLLYRVMKSSYASANTKAKLDIQMPTVTYSKSVAISGKINTDTKLYINDELMPVDYNGRFNVTYTLLKEAGSYDFVFKTIRNGVVETERRTVNYIISSPVITLDDKSNETDSATYKISGTVLDNADRCLSLTINGKYVDIDYYNSTFSESYTLKSGMNSFTIEATNSSGKITTLVKEVTFNSEGPKITFSNYTETVTSKSYTLNGTVKDVNDTRPKLYVNNKSFYLGYSSSFSANCSLSEGDNVFVFKAINKLGEITEVTRTIKYNPGAPAITFDNMPDSSIKKTVKLMGTVKDVNDSRPAFYINDESAYINYSGYFSESVTLKDGENIFIFRAKNDDGKETTITKKIIYAPGAPEITFTNIVEKSTKKTIEIAGKIVDKNDTSPKFYINNSSVSHNYNGFSKEYTLTEGDNSFVFKAVNKDGKETIINKTIVFEPSKPVLTVDVPAAVNTDAVDMIINVKDENDRNANITVTVNGRSVSYSSYKFTYRMNLVEGPNTFNIVAINTAGKRTEMTKQIEYKIVAPEIVTDMPAKVNVGTYTITGNVVDNSGTKPTFTVNGGSANLSYSNYQFNQTVTLVEGANTFVLKATSTANGRSGELTKTLVWEILNPELNVSVPGSNDTDTLVISGNVYDKVDDAVTVEVNGAAVNQSSSGSWNYTLSLVDGSNTVTIVAKNKYGKETKIEKAVTYTAPTVEETPTPAADTTPDPAPAEGEGTESTDDTTPAAE